MNRFTAHWGITACPSYLPSLKEGWETQCPSSLPDKYSLRINLCKTHGKGMECEKACCHRGSEPWVSGRLMPGGPAGMHGSGSESKGQSCIWEREKGSMRPAGQWGHSLVNRENVDTSCFVVVVFHLSDRVKPLGIPGPVASTVKTSSFSGSAEATT